MYIVDSCWEFEFDIYIGSFVSSNWGCRDYRVVGGVFFRFEIQDNNSIGMEHETKSNDKIIKDVHSVEKEKTPGETKRKRFLSHRWYHV